MGVTDTEFEVENLPGLFGARVKGVSIAEGMARETLRGLIDLAVRHRFIVLPGQHLSNDDYVAFARRWGQPVILISRSNRLESHPEMISQGNSAATPVFLRNVASNWHCDSSYEETVASFTMLYGIESPDEGGETLFADLGAAFDALPDADKARYEAMTVKHATSAATPLPDERIVTRDTLPEEMRRNVVQLDPVAHPLVQRHPLTGSRAFYGLGGSCYAIEGLTEAEGADLLLDLRRYVTQEKFRTSYKLMPGEVVIWDNFGVIHRATPIEFSDEPGRRRLNYRISLKGVPAEY